MYLCACLPGEFTVRSECDFHSKKKKVLISAFSDVNLVHGLKVMTWLYSVTYDAVEQGKQ